MNEGCPFVKPMKIQGNKWQAKIDGKIIFKNIMKEIHQNIWDKLQFAHVAKFKKITSMFHQIQNKRDRRSI